jgi:hypothetical protein
LLRSGSYIPAPACRVTSGAEGGFTGYRPGGLAELAAPVDGVLRAQLLRLKSFVETGKPGT